MLTFPNEKYAVILYQQVYCITKSLIKLQQTRGKTALRANLNANAKQPPVCAYSGYRRPQCCR